VKACTIDHRFVSYFVFRQSQVDQITAYTEQMIRMTYAVRNGEGLSFE
jgi:hypothetical protein